MRTLMDYFPMESHIFFNQTSSLNMYYYVNMDWMENNIRLHGKYKYFMQPGIYYN